VAGGGRCWRPRARWLWLRAAARAAQQLVVVVAATVGGAALLAARGRAAGRANERATTRAEGGYNRCRQWRINYQQYIEVSNNQTLRGSITEN